MRADTLMHVSDIPLRFDDDLIVLLRDETVLMELTVTKKVEETK